MAGLTDRPKRRLLFLSGADRSLEYFRVSSVEPLRAWLGLHFDLSEAGDTSASAEELLRQYDPEMVLFLSTERGMQCEVGAGDGGRPFPENIPTAGITLMDADSPAKTTLFSEAARLRLDALFTMDSSFAALAPPELRGRIVYCPWFVNTGYCRDYALEKTMPVGLFGEGFSPDSGFLSYPWRASVGQVVRRRYPCLSVPTPNVHVAPHQFVGKEYARLLNRTQVALTCGGARQIMVKKHLEIPACGTCLVTEASLVLEQLGFRDMENCVLVDAGNAAEKLDALFAEPERLAEITRAGSAFVHERHSAEARDTIASWLESQLDKTAPAASSISLGSDELAGAPFFEAYGRALEALRDRLDHRAAAEVLEEASKYSRRSPELTFFKAACHFLDGRAADAEVVLNDYFRTALRWHSIQPDPAMWGLYLLAQHSLARAEIVDHLAGSFPVLDHALIRRARSLAGAAGGGSAGASPSFLLPDEERWQPLAEALCEAASAPEDDDDPVDGRGGWWSRLLGRG